MKRKLFVLSTCLGSLWLPVFAQTPDTTHSVKGGASEMASQGWQWRDYTTYNAERFFALPQVQQPLNPKAIDYKLLHAAVFYATNRARQQHDRQPFKHSPALEVAATGHSQAMTQHDFFRTPVWYPAWKACHNG